MTVKRRPQGKGKSRGRDDALTFEEWKRRKSDERTGAPAAKPTAPNSKEKTRQKHPIR